MSRFAVRLPAILLLAGLCLAVTLPSRAAAEIGERQREILNVLADQVKAWNDGDIEGYMEGYVHSDSLRFASGGDITYGWGAALERYEERYPSKSRMGTLSFSDLDVTLLSDDAALVFGKWNLKRRHDEPWGLFTLLVRRTGDGWRIVHDHTSSGED
jgi:ketosteroid isomerase-like protein